MLDKIALASWLVVGVIAICGAALLLGEISFEQFERALIGVGVLSGGAAGIGHVRNQAGKGIGRKR